MIAKLLAASASGVVMVAAVLLAAPNVAAHGAVVPFRLSITGVAQFSSPSAITFSGSGTAWHMGAITSQGTATDFTPATTCPQAGINNLHTETFTDADGSTVSILSRDIACWEGPALLHCVTCTWSVTGGTGRFSDARGTGDLDGYLDLASGSFWGTYTGTISY